MLFYISCPNKTDLVCISFFVCGCKKPNLVPYTNMHFKLDYQITSCEEKNEKKKKLYHHASPPHLLKKFTCSLQHTFVTFFFFGLKHLWKFSPREGVFSHKNLLIVSWENQIFRERNAFTFKRTFGKRCHAVIFPERHNKMEKKKNNLQFVIKLVWECSIS